MLRKKRQNYIKFSVKTRSIEKVWKTNRNKEQSNKYGKY